MSGETSLLFNEPEQIGTMDSNTSRYDQQPNQTTQAFDLAPIQIRTNNKIKHNVPAETTKNYESNAQSRNQSLKSGPRTFMNEIQTPVKDQHSRKGSERQKKSLKKSIKKESGSPTHPREMIISSSMNSPRDTSKDKQPALNTDIS